MIAISIHDLVYLVDYCVDSIDLFDKSGQDGVADFIIKTMEDYERKNAAKFIGAGVPLDLIKKYPKLCSRLWLELDVVPISIAPEQDGLQMGTKERTFWESKCVDEQADSMARKCIMHFGPSLALLVQVGFRGRVDVDAGLQARLMTADDYKTTCSASTWDVMMKYATSLKEHKTKIAFFSSTPQGGGVAIMRHALVRFAKAIGVDLSW
jgi:hypothetical protein